MMSSQVKTMPSLGRPFNLGILYDACTEQIIEKSPWNIESLSSAANKDLSVSQLGFKVLGDDTLPKKFTHLNIPASQRLSYLSGLVRVKGSAEYLKDEKSSDKHCRAALHCKSITHHESLDLKQLGPMELPEVLESCMATHLVVGITYGADAFFVFDQFVADSKDFRACNDAMQAQIKASLGESSQCVTEGFDCIFYGDVSLSSIPTTFGEAVSIYKSLQGDSFADQSIPKIISLLPLSALTAKVPQQFFPLSSDIIMQVEDIMESFSAVKLCANGLLTMDMCCKFDNLRKQLKNFVYMIEVFKEKLVQKLCFLLPNIRNGKAKSSELAELISSISGSPFGIKETNKFLRSKSREINRLSVFLEKLRELKTPEIVYDLPSTSGKLEQLIAENQANHILCFAFNTISDSIPYLKNLEAFLASEGTNSLMTENKEWFRQPTQLDQSLTNFLEFVESNPNSGNMAFVVTDCNDETDSDGPAIILYVDGEPSEFEPPGQPECLQTRQVTTNSIEIAWTPPACGAYSVSGYNVTYCCKMARGPTNTVSISTGATRTSLKLVDLLPGHDYEFQVQAVCEFGVSKKSKSCTAGTVPYVRPADRIFKFSKRIKAGKPAVYQLPFNTVYKNPRDGLYKCDVGIRRGRHLANKPERVLMVLGATGAGKSTLINGIVNYLFEVKWEDDFRFKIISDDGNQSYSQTKAITAYSLHSTILPYTLTIVDTPGFGDTSGIERDKQIAHQIQQFFSESDRGGIECLHGIGFVTQASLARLTPTQKYIFDAVLSIFGKDISENIFLLATFADAIKPPVLQATKTANIPYQASFKFNNSALFTSNDSSDSAFNSMFWEMGYSSFREFFKHFSKTEAKSLALTREVLKERNMLETLIPGLQQQVRIGLIQLDVIQQEERVLKQHEAEINANKNFTFEIEVTRFRKNPLPTGWHTTACMKCNFTCHENCIIPNDDGKERCWAMTNGSCRICPDKCHWSSHSNLPHIIEYYSTTETRTSDDLKRQYDTAKSGKENAVAMIAENEMKLNVMQVEVYLLIEQARESIKRLEEIALKPNPLTELEYLDLLIESEEIEARPGFEKRIAQYRQLRKNAEIMKTVVPKVSTKEPKSKSWWQTISSYISYK